MKKIFLLSICIAVLTVLAFAVSVSAEVVISENNLDENGDIVADVLLDKGDNRHILSVDITYTDINGESKSGKLYYETSHWGARNMKQMKYTYIPADFDFSQIVYIFDKADFNGDGSYASNELIKLYEGGGGSGMFTYTSYENGSFTDAADAKPYLEAVSYSKYFVKFPDNGFASKAPKLSAMTYNGHELVENTLIISSQIDEIFSGSFGGDGQSLVENSIVPAYKRLVFEDRNISTHFGQYSFTRVAFEEIVFGSGTYHLGNEQRIALIFTENYPDDATLKRVVVKADTVISNGEISWNVGTHDVIFAGTQAEYDEKYESNCKKALPCADEILIDPCYIDGHQNPGDDGNCETAVLCSVCGKYTFTEATAHNNGKALKYENLFTDGYYYEGCMNDGCTVGTTQTAKALFSYIGYSVSTYLDTYSIMQCFKVNDEAIESYAELYGDISFGVVASVNNLNPLCLENVKVNVNGKALFAELGSINDEGKLVTAYSYFEIKLTGIAPTETARFVLCAYAVLEKDGVATLVYLDGGETLDSAVGTTLEERN